jgi:dipeptidyl aminopeptidase/acylaminoacyl peptidase
MRRRQDSNRNRPHVPGIEISEERSPVQSVTVTAQDGNSIEVAVRMPPGDGPFPAVIFIHGGMRESDIDGRMGGAKGGALQTRLLEAGYVIVLSTFRTYELNSRHPGPIYDSVAVVDYVKTMPQVDGQSVVVFGASGGGRLALELAGLGARTGLAAIVCGEPATTLYAEMYPEGMKGPNMNVSRNHQKYYGEKNSGILDEKVGRLSCPVLIVHSDVHQINDVNNEYLIPKIRAQGKDLETILYPGLDHGFYWGQGWTGVTEAVFESLS